MKYDVTIIGAGIVGASLAIALAELGLQVALIDQADFPSAITAEIDTRVSAINFASKTWFEQINIWPSIKDSRISTYEKMFVWDDEGQIEFDAALTVKPELGFIIENQVMQVALAKKIKTFPNIHYFPNCTPVTLHTMYDGNYLLLNNDKRLFSNLIVGADGAHSWLRKILNISTKVESYEQIAIVANIKTEKPHNKTAYQHFLATGPLAFLPFADAHTCSIVWSLEKEKAAELLSDNDEIFNRRLSAAFEYKLGKAELCSERKSFPLVMRHAEEYIAERIVLVGDAIHTIHPLAGLGLNLGLADVKELTNLITEAINKKQDIANKQLLAAFQRNRKVSNFMVLTSMSAFKNLFSNDNQILHWLRNQGLMLVNQIPSVKNLIIEKANQI